MFARAISPWYKSAVVLTLVAASAFAADPAKTPHATAAKASSSTSAPAAADTAVTEKTTVYITSGSRYHLKGCRYLKGKGKASTIGEAMKQGLAPCNVCHAPKLKPKTEE